MAAARLAQQDVAVEGLEEELGAAAGDGARELLGDRYPVLALGLVLLGSFAGVMMLRHAGGSHIARVRVAMAEANFSALQADTTGGLILLAGILLAIPGFITDAIGVALLVAPLRRALLGVAGLRPSAARRPADGVVDLEPEQWHRVPDPTLPGRRDDEHGDR